MWSNYTIFIIYEITNLINDKKYIGKHKTDDINDDYMGSGLLIRKAILKYGLEYFRKEILYIFDNEEDVINKEKELITDDVCKSNKFYNIAYGGQGGCIVLKEGHPKRLETCKKISEAAIKRREEISRNASILHKQKRIGMYNKKHSEETKQKMKESAKHIDRSYLIGRIVSEETCQKLSKSKLGKKRSKETRQIISENHANVNGEQNPMYGKIQSSETKRKISEANKNKPKLECPYCKGFFSKTNFIRWHDKNCKEKYA